MQRNYVKKLKGPESIQMCSPPSGLDFMLQLSLKTLWASKSFNAMPVLHMVICEATHATKNVTKLLQHSRNARIPEVVVLWWRVLDITLISRRCTCAVVSGDCFTHTILKLSDVSLLNEHNFEAKQDIFWVNNGVLSSRTYGSSSSDWGRNLFPWVFTTGIWFMGRTLTKSHWSFPFPSYGKPLLKCIQSDLIKADGTILSKWMTQTMVQDWRLKNKLLLQLSMGAFFIQFLNLVHPSNLVFTPKRFSWRWK